MKNWERLLLTALFATLFILVHGYQFNNGDQEEHLPYVYKLMDSSLYQNDYLVPLQTTQFTVRFYFAHLIKYFGFILSIPNVVLFLYLLCLFIVGWVVSTIAENISKSQSVGILAPMLLILFNNYTIGGNSIIDVQLTSTVLSVALGAIAFLYFSKGKMVQASAFCGLASLFQVLIGLQLFILLFITAFSIVNKNKWKQGAKHILSYLLFAGWMLFPMLLIQFGSKSTLETEKYYDILFYFRNAHHYHPFCFPLGDYIKTLLWWSIILFSVWAGKKRHQLYPFNFLLFLTGFGCILYFIGFTQLHIFSIGKLQWFKATIWPTFLGVIPVSIIISEKAKATSALYFTKIRSLLCAFLVIILWIGLSNSAFVPLEKFRYRYKLGNYPQQNLEKMHVWISQNTAINAVFLTFPNDDSFLCEAKRSLSVAYKGVIHQPDFLLPWHEKMKDIYGIELSDKKCRKILDEATVLYSQRTDEIIKSTTVINYRLWNLNEIDSAKLNWNQLIHREGEILLFSFTKEK